MYSEKDRKKEYKKIRETLEEMRVRYEKSRNRRDKIFRDLGIEPVNPTYDEIIDKLVTKKQTKITRMLVR